VVGLGYVGPPLAVEFGKKFSHPDRPQSVRAADPHLADHAADDL